MNNLKRYEGLIIFVIVMGLITYLWAGKFVIPTYKNYKETDTKRKQTDTILSEKQDRKTNVENRLKEAKNNVNSEAQKKIYSPIESDLGNDTLFFTLYSDFIEMIHANSIKIKSIDYKYNPEDDEFVASEKDYFVFDVNVELVSNYTNLGKLIENIYQYPYYLKINSLDVKPYNKDKKILISNLSVRLYAHTEPEQ